MATNKIMDEGRNIELAIAGKTSNDPVMKGKLPGVALIDTDSDGNVSIDTGPAVYDLSVKAINDAGNSAVAVGDEIFYTDTDTPKLNKKASGIFYGIALEVVALGATDTINVKLMYSEHQGADSIKQLQINRRYMLEEFESAPLCSLSTGAAVGGTAGNVNVMALEENLFEYVILGTQTIKAPVLAAGGLDFGLDQTENDGVEVTKGITARSRGAFVIGTDAFYAKLKFSIANVSGTDDCAFGFRGAEAYAANIDDYNDMAALNVISGNINIETILNDGATTTTDTTDDWADGETHTLEIYVSAAGVVTYMIDGAAPTTTAAFTFDDTDTVVPFFYFLNAAAPVAGALLIQSLEYGLQE